MASAGQAGRGSRGEKRAPYTGHELAEKTIQDIDFSVIMAGHERDLWVKAGRAYVAAGEPGAAIFNEENFMKVAAHAVKTQQELPI